MSDDLANRLKATLHLMEEAADWERIARDESIDPNIRHEAGTYAKAIREEMRPC